MAAEHNTGIYEIRNLVNGKRYVGSAVHFGYRWTKHQTELAKKKHHSRHLQRAWDKYGAENFEFKRLIFCARENLIMYEQAAMDAFSPEYNIAPKAGSALGVVRTPEAMAQMVATRLARGGYAHTLQSRAKIKEARSRQVIKKHSAETRAKMKVIQQNKDHPHLVAVWAKKVGVARTAEVRQKISQSIGIFSEQQIREIRARCASGELQKHVAASLGIRQSCVSEIVRGVSYAWVQ